MDKTRLEPYVILGVAPLSSPTRRGLQKFPMRKHIEVHPCGKVYVLGNLFFYSQLDIYKKTSPEENLRYLRRKPPLLEKKTSAT